MLPPTAIASSFGILAAPHSSMKASNSFVMLQLEGLWRPDSVQLKDGASASNISGWGQSSFWHVSSGTSIKAARQTPPTSSVLFVGGVAAAVGHIKAVGCCFYGAAVYVVSAVAFRDALLSSGSSSSDVSENKAEK